MESESVQMEPKSLQMIKQELQEQSKKSLEMTARIFYRIIALKERVSEEEAVELIKQKISCGINNEDPEIREKWLAIAHEGETITPYDYVMHLLDTHKTDIL